jgi:hypothetical protein
MSTDNLLEYSHGPFCSTSCPCGKGNYPAKGGSVRKRTITTDGNGEAHITLRAEDVTPAMREAVHSGKMCFLTAFVGGEVIRMDITKTVRRLADARGVPAYTPTTPDPVRLTLTEP